MKKTVMNMWERAIKQLSTGKYDVAEVQKRNRQVFMKYDGYGCFYEFRINNGFGCMEVVCSYDSLKRSVYIKRDMTLCVEELCDNIEASKGYAFKTAYQELNKSMTRDIISAIRNQGYKVENVFLEVVVETNQDNSCLFIKKEIAKTLLKGE